jgi:hypothetical protein
MINIIQKNIGNKLRELVKTDRDLQIAIAQEINVAVITVYHWAAYHPERLARNKAAIRIAKRYLKRLQKNTAKTKKQPII